MMSSMGDGVTLEEPTRTSIEQNIVQRAVVEIYNTLHGDDHSNNPSTEIFHEKHIRWLNKGLKGLPGGYSSLDASRPWLCYWTFHALDLLDVDLHKYVDQAADFLARCQDVTGGFAGGPGQLPHLATTYSATLALMVLGDRAAYTIIDRKKMHDFLRRRKNPDGGFTMHDNGEEDVRAVYCALVVASLLDILTPDLVHGAAEWIARCQTYEGGLGGCPGNEAHGGYTFCGLAAMVILGKTHLLDMDRLAEWAVARQMPNDLGFQGRTNKLVDSCYSFWQGAVFPLIHHHFRSSHPAPTNPESKANTNNATSLPTEGWLFNQLALQQYIVMCAQAPTGGFKDKPGKYPDYYHSCYALSGLSIAQHNSTDIGSFPSSKQASPPPTSSEEEQVIEVSTESSEVTIFGSVDNLVEATHPVYNIRPERLAKSMSYFRSLGPL